MDEPHEQQDGEENRIMPNTVPKKEITLPCNPLEMSMDDECLDESHDHEKKGKDFHSVPYKEPRQGSNRGFLVV